MLKQTSKEFKTLFLLKFTNELIRNSLPKEMILPQKPQLIIPPKKQQAPPQIQKIFKPLPRPLAIRRLAPQRRVLTIPEQRLPQRLEYLRPIPGNKEIDLDKLNPLLQDPIVKLIECKGPDKNLLVRGTMGLKTTKIILNKQEINHIIEKFSEVAKIPVSEGVFKVAVGKLILTAIISEITGSKFIIQKMMYAPQPILRR